MTTEKYNIDKAFKDKFDKVSVDPPRYLWDDLKASLDMETRKRKRKFIWYAAASFALLLAFGSGYFISLNINQPNVNLVDNGNSNNGIVNPIIQNENLKDFLEFNSPKDNSFTKETLTNQNTNENHLVADVQKTNRSQNTDVKIKPENQNTIIKEVENIQKLTTNSIATALVADCKNILKGKEAEFWLPDLITTTSTKQSGKWSIGGSVSPLYSYRDIAANTSQNNMLSEVSSQMVDFGGRNSPSDFENQEYPLMAYAGAVNVSYEAGKRLSFHSGLGYSKIGQQTENLYLFEQNGAYSESMTIINSSSGQIKSDENSIEFINQVASKGSELLAMDAYGDYLYQNPSNLVQNFEYIEMPLLMKYKVIDKNIDLNLIAGLNTGFLIGNNAYVVINDAKHKVGETDAVRSMNYSGTVGLGLNYEISNSVLFQVEPIFKYSIQTINKHNSSSHPYSIGIYTGCSYKF